MNILILTVGIFIVVVLIIELITYSYRNVKNPDRARIRKQLKKISASKQKDELPVDLMRKRVLSEVPALNKILLRITMIDRLDRLRYLANARYPAGFFILLALLFAGAGFLIFYLMKIGMTMSVAFSICLGCIPFLYLYIKKNQRMKKFQAQLPESLDLMARSLRAGHAFSTGMKLAADEFDDPLGTEFSITLDEINYGLGVSDALKNLVHRVECQDLNFFVIAVILQRETGGNLAEIMEGIAYLIRERYKLYGKVRTLAAEGKLSMYVLLALPFFIIGALLIVNPGYIKTLFTEPAGRIMCAIAAFMMLLGAIVMKRMVNIKV
jgi:tight adherence protein B